MTDVFRIPAFQFPKDFLWGSATAAFQIEGNNFWSDLWFDEQELLKRDPSAEVSGTACNSYRMAAEDVELLQTLGHRAYRFGIEWARIEPEEGVFNEEAAEHYVRQLVLLKERKIKTFVTLVHKTVPQWFRLKGGFEDLDNRRYFERYLHYILPKIAPYVDFWNVLNEFNLWLSADGMLRKRNSLLFHALGYHLIKQYSSAPVSSAHALVMYFAKRQFDAFDRAAAQYYDVVDNEFFFHAIRTGEVVLPGTDALYDRDIRDTSDFWSINIYTRSMVDMRKANGKGERYPFTKARTIRMEHFYLDEFYPETVYHSLMRLKDKPVYITENGYSCEDDRLRIVFLTEYLSALHTAIEEGVDVRGYLYWSLLDNFEWGSYLPRFGLVSVDRENGFRRTPKPSAYFYREIIENNGYSPEILQKYLSEIPRIGDVPVVK